MMHGHTYNKFLSLPRIQPRVVCQLIQNNMAEDNYFRTSTLWLSSIYNAFTLMAMHTLHKGTVELYSQHKKNLQDHCWRSDASCHDASGRTVGQRLICLVVSREENFRKWLKRRKYFGGGLQWTTKLRYWPYVQHNNSPILISCSATSFKLPC